jgi:hypothetical protein
MTYDEQHPIEETAAAHHGGGRPSSFSARSSTTAPVDLVRRPQLWLAAPGPQPQPAVSQHAVWRLRTRFESASTLLVPDRDGLDRPGSKP